MLRASPLLLRSRVRIFQKANGVFSFNHRIGEKTFRFLCSSAIDESEMGDDFDIDEEDHIESDDESSSVTPEPVAESLFGLYGKKAAEQFLETRINPIEQQIIDGIHEEIVRDLSEDEFLKVYKLVQTFLLAQLRKDQMGPSKLVSSLQNIVNRLYPVSMRKAIIEYSKNLSLDKLEVARKKNTSVYVSYCNGRRLKHPNLFRNVVLNEAKENGHEVYKVFIQDLPFEITPQHLFEASKKLGDIFACEILSERCRFDEIRLPAIKKLRNALSNAFMGAEKSLQSHLKKLEKESEESANEAGFEVLKALKTRVLHKLERKLGENTAQVVNDMAHTGINGFLYFKDKESYDKFLSPPLRIFGFKILYRMCATSAPSKYLHISNLSVERGRLRQVETALSDLIAEHSPFGQLSPIMQAESFKGGNYAFEFESHEHAYQVFCVLSGKSVDGKKIRIGFMTEQEVQDRDLFIEPTD